MLDLVVTQWEELPKKQSEGVRFCLFGTENTVLYCRRFCPLGS